MLEILWSLPEDRSLTSIAKTIQSSIWDFLSRALLLPGLVVVSAGVTIHRKFGANTRVARG